MYCGACGTLFQQKMCRGKAYWVCGNHRRDKNNCPTNQIPETEIQAAFLRLYHKLKTHGIPVLEQMLSDLQAVREKQMLWSVDVIELNKRISDLSNQNRMLADMKKLGLVDSDIFIAKTNELARQLSEAKQQKAKVLEDTQDETIPKTQELMELLDELPDTLTSYDQDIFETLIEKITVESNVCLRFHLKNAMVITENIGKEAQ